jgi:hypothetical protein
LSLLSSYPKAHAQLGIKSEVVELMLVDIHNCSQLFVLLEIHALFNVEFKVT